MEESLVFPPGVHSYKCVTSHENYSSVSPHPKQVKCKLHPTANFIGQLSHAFTWQEKVRRIQFRVQKNHR